MDQSRLKPPPRVSCPTAAAERASRTKFDECSPPGNGYLSPVSNSSIDASTPPTLVGVVDVTDQRRFFLFVTTKLFQQPCHIVCNRTGDRVERLVRLDSLLHVGTEKIDLSDDPAVFVTQDIESGYDRRRPGAEVFVEAVGLLLESEVLGQHLGKAKQAAEQRRLRGCRGNGIELAAQGAVLFLDASGRMTRIDRKPSLALVVGRHGCGLLVLGYYAPIRTPFLTRKPCVHANALASARCVNTEMACMFRTTALRTCRP